MLPDSQIVLHEKSHQSHPATPLAYLSNPPLGQSLNPSHPATELVSMFSHLELDHYSSKSIPLTSLLLFIFHSCHEFELFDFLGQLVHCDFAGIIGHE